MKVSIMIADDHEVMRNSIVTLLRKEVDFEIVGECSNGIELLQMVSINCPDVAIVDIEMPELNGIEITPNIIRKCPLTRVIALSNHIDKSYIHAMLNRGAVSYIVKSGIVKDLVYAIENASKENIYLSQEISKYIKDEWVNGDNKNASLLS
jgi:two-component system, NarL family, response regulator NreC